MRKAFFLLLSFAAFVACSTPEGPDGPQPEQPEQNTEISIVVDESRLTAYQVIYSIYPEDKDAYF